MKKGRAVFEIYSILTRPRGSLTPFGRPVLDATHLSQAHYYYRHLYAPKEDLEFLQDQPANLLLFVLQYQWQDIGTVPCRGSLEIMIAHPVFSVN